jgi:hypothetical protein
LRCVKIRHGILLHALWMIITAKLVARCCVAMSFVHLLRIAIFVGVASANYFKTTTISRLTNWHFSCFIFRHQVKEEQVFEKRLTIVHLSEEVNSYFFLCLRCCGCFKTYHPDFLHFLMHESRKCKGVRSVSQIVEQNFNSIFRFVGQKRLLLLMLRSFLISKDSKRRSTWLNSMRTTNISTDDRGRELLI